MKTLTIKFEFPQVFNHQEILEAINGSITDMEPDLAGSMTYTVVERK